VTGADGGVMVDCGRDWCGELERLAPVAVVLTHAHPDHAGGLLGDVPCPVFATSATWEALRRHAVDRRRTIEPRRPHEVAGLSFEAFPVEHSIRAPAVGYRIGDGTATLFYAPDLVAIEDEAAALAGIDLYVGDGAAITRSIVRRRDGRRIGHASIRVQVAWCEAAEIPQAVFTHCGTEIVRGDPGAVEERVRALGREHGLAARLAQGGLRPPSVARCPWHARTTGSASLGARGSARPVCRGQVTSQTLQRGCRRQTRRSPDDPLPRHSPSSASWRGLARRARLLPGGGTGSGPGGLEDTPGPSAASHADPSVSPYLASSRATAQTWHAVHVDRRLDQRDSTGDPRPPSTSGRDPRRRGSDGGRRAVSIASRTPPP
jgi:phosphoribosyl 1,2-cyclic phosphodiesterase